jgi:hypothetical protein
MALREALELRKIETVYTSFGYPVLQIKYARVVYSGDEKLAETAHREMLLPDADLTNKMPEIVSVAEVVFTDAAKAAYATATGGE